MSLPSALLFPLGLFVGLLTWSRAVYVSYGIYGSLKHVDFRQSLKNPTDDLVSKVLLILVVASCAWMLAFGTVAFFLNSAGSGWAWFFGGVTATPALPAMTTYRALRKLSKYKAQQAQP